MARPRRRMTRKSARPKADWVYRGPLMPFGFEPGGYLDAQATYDNGVNTLVPGPPNAMGMVLYDSQNFFADLGRGGQEFPAGTPAGFLGRPARAEGQRPLILKSEGVIAVSPSAWAVGSSFDLGIRIGAFEQSKEGTFSLDPAYSMWAPSVVAPYEQLNEWANFRRANRKEWRIFKAYGDGVAYWGFRFRWQGRARLDPHDCWGLYVESSQGSVTLQCQFWWRSLVVDDD